MVTGDSVFECVAKLRLQAVAALSYALAERMPRQQFGLALYADANVW